MSKRNHKFNCTSQIVQNVSGPIAPEATSEILYTSLGSVFGLDCVQMPVNHYVLCFTSDASSTHINI